MPPNTDTVNTAQARSRTSRPLRIAMLSYWNLHAEGYSKDAIAHPEVDLVAAWDDDAERGQAAATRFGLEFVPSLDALLQRDDVDGVIVQSSTASHYEIVKRALEAGKHVLSQKVLTPTGDEARRLVAQADASSLVLWTGLYVLSHDYVDRLRTLIASGELGAIVNLRLMNCHGRAIEGTLPERWYDPAQASGGAAIDLCHACYLVPYLLGARPRAVCALNASITERLVEDSTVALFAFDHGIHATAEVGFATPGAPIVEIEVNGTRASVIYRCDFPWIATGAPAEHLFEMRERGGRSFKAVPLGDAQPDAISQWVQHINSKSRPTENIDQAILLSDITEAIYKSASERRWVELASAQGRVFND